MEKLIEWLCYNVALPLSAVPLVLIGTWMLGARKKLTSIIGNGQLCFYCTTLAARTIYELFSVNTASGASVSMGILVIGMIFCIMLSIFAYGVAVNATATDEARVSAMSLGCVTVTIILAVWARKTVGLL